MSLTISPTALLSLGATSPTTTVGTSTGGSMSAPGAMSPTIAMALQQIETGPLGLSPPRGAEDMAALLSKVEMDLDKTSTTSRSIGLANALQGRRSSLSDGLAGVETASAALAADQTVGVGDKTALADATSNLSGDQTRLAADQAMLTADQTTRQSLAGQSTTLGSEIAAQNDEAAGLDAQIADAVALDPNADVSALVSRRDAAVSLAAGAQADKDTIDHKVATSDTAIAQDQAAVTAEQAIVSTDVNAVSTATNSLATDETRVARDTGALSDALAARSQSIALAFSRLALTLRTGDGQFQRNAGRSVQLDLGFQSLAKATVEISSHETRRTAQSKAALETIETRGNERREIDKVAAGLVAGLAEVQATLAALKQQIAPDAASQRGRLRLSL